MLRGLACQRGGGPDGCTAEWSHAPLPGAIGVKALVRLTAQASFQDPGGSRGTQKIVAKQNSVKKKRQTKELCPAFGQTQKWQAARSDPPTPSGGGITDLEKEVVTASPGTCDLLRELA